jgi:hypothetical protein
VPPILVFAPALSNSAGIYLRDMSGLPLTPGKPSFGDHRVHGRCPIPSADATPAQPVPEDYPVGV